MSEDPVGAISTCPMRRLAFLFIVVVFLAPTATASGQCVSTPGVTPPFLPNPNKTLLTVEARAEYILLPDTLWPYHFRSPRGQVVAVEELEGPGRAELGPDSLAIIVQWRSGDEMWGCRAYPTRDSLPAGSGLSADGQAPARQPVARGAPDVRPAPGHLFGL